MAPSDRAGDRQPLSADAVVDAAIAIIEDRGPNELTMRSLAAAVGAAPTAVYWHVGDKDAVLDAVAERVIVDASHLEPDGDALIERIVSIGSKLRRFLSERRLLVGIAHERGRTAHLFHPARRMVVRELIDAGLPPDRVAFAAEATMFVVSGSLLTDLAVARSPEHVDHTELWTLADVEGADDPEKLLAALGHRTDADQLFERTLTAFLTGLL
jgi:AcrR family transcriptional regulator